MKFFHSIRWRLQLWHGVLLTVVLAGFGFTAWRLQRATRFERVDQELEQRVSVVAGALRRGAGAPGRPPQERSPFREPSPAPSGLRLPEREAALFEPAAGQAFYYVAWLPGGQEAARSGSAPPEVPRPERGPQARDARLRGRLREYFHHMPPGECILVGRDVRSELADIRRFAWLLVGAGIIVLGLGLSGGWWISARALRPLGDISAAASRIALGDLGQRIQTADTRSELGDLARILNSTFGRLQASFARQAQFTADASHELRTPLSVVVTQTQTALSRERSAAEYRESLVACQRAAQRMRRLTDALLLLARLDGGDAEIPREVCALDRIAQEATELWRSRAQDQDVDLTTELTPVACEGNPEQLARVVSNLVSNAIDYNRPGGQVQVRVAAEADTAVLTVSDTGQGIAPQELPLIFERFYRVDPARSRANDHAGLGLSITKAIVEAHAGQIQVTSEPAKGSTFTVRLPRARGSKRGA